MSSAIVISERQFTEQIRDVTRAFGYLRYHTWTSLHSPAGWVDEVLVRPPRTIFAELKAEKGKVTSAQEAWLDALTECGHETYLWRPSMLEVVIELLRPRLRPAAGEREGAWVA